MAASEKPGDLPAARGASLGVPGRSGGVFMANGLFCHA